MIKLFGQKQVPPEAPAPIAEHKYTRFPHRHTRTMAPAPKAAAPQPCQAAPATPAPRPARAKPQAKSLADQLHSDERISTALLRRALPLRFAAIDKDTSENMQKNLQDLQPTTH